MSGNDEFLKKMAERKQSFAKIKEIGRVPCSLRERACFLKPEDLPRGASIIADRYPDTKAGHEAWEKESANPVQRKHDEEGPYTMQIMLEGINPHSSEGRQMLAEYLDGTRKLPENKKPKEPEGSLIRRKIER